MAGDARRPSTSTRPARASRSCARRSPTHQRRFYGIELDPDGEVLVTTGATEAIAAALLALCEPGDEVVTFEPYYDSYAACIALAGAERRPVTLRPPDYALDPDALAAAFTPRTRLVLLNSPHNPTGKVFTRDELELIAAHCRERDVLAVTDEVYEHLVVRRPRARPARRRCPGMAGAHADDLLRRQDVLVHRLEDRLGDRPARARRAPSRPPSSSSPSSAARRSSPRSPTRWGSRTPTSNPSAPTCRPSATGCAPASRRPDWTSSARPARTSSPTDIRPLGEHDGHAFCLALPERAGVVAVPTVVFYDDEEVGRPLVRFAFCKRDAVIDEAAARLARLSG